MALSALQRLLQKSPPPRRILASLHNPVAYSPIAPCFPSQSPHLEAQTSENGIANGSPLVDSFKAENLARLHPSLFFPISPIGFFSYPILSTGSIQDGLEEEDSGMWADSVKKKRKKKMNKHKYQKLRKRLRKQT